MTRVAIVDYGVGNLRSVEKMVARAGADPMIAATREELAAADAIVLPGVGAFGTAMANLNESGLVPALLDLVGNEGRPILGICLGFQLLAQRSAESPEIDGLGLLSADVRRLSVEGRTDWLHRRLSLPHIAWNSVEARTGATLFADVPEASDFYFAHSYAVACDDDRDEAAWTTYGERFCCAAESGNVMGVQFHPEKSQVVGQAILRSFVTRQARATA